MPTVGWLPPGFVDFAKVLNIFPHAPTYFDCCFVACVNSVASDPAIMVLVEAGYRPGPALHEAAASGRLEEFMIFRNVVDDTGSDLPPAARGAISAATEKAVKVRAKAAVAWVLGKRVGKPGVEAAAWTGVR
tara:strand:+ start:1033 stop:1428 length:396 start_codon:yes stop_codon:yes gene_type:complete